MQSSLPRSAAGCFFGIGERRLVLLSSGNVVSLVKHYIKENL